MLREGGGEGSQVGVRIGGVVHARAAVKAAIEELMIATGTTGCRNSRGIGCGSGDMESVEEMVGFSGEPCGVARLEDGGAWILVAEQTEEGLGHYGVER